MEFMTKMSVRKIPFIGRMTELILSELSIFTCSDVLEKAAEITISFSERTSSFLIESALGVARNCHTEDEDDTQKSISISSTFRPIVLKE